MKHIVLLVLLVFGKIADALPISGNVAVASRVLKRSSVDVSRAKLEESTQDILEELYFPSPFYCDSSTDHNGYSVYCISLESICREGGNCATVEWEASFSSFLQPKKEHLCISHSNDDCDELDGELSCYSFNYSGNTATSCVASIGDKRCDSCEICGYLENTDEWIQFMSVDCSNLEGFESKYYECEDVQTADNMVDAMFLCPANHNEAHHYEEIEFAYFENANACIEHCESLRFSYHATKKCVNNCKMEYPDDDDDDKYDDDGDDENELSFYKNEEQTYPDLRSCISHCNHQWSYFENKKCIQDCEDAFPDDEEDFDDDNDGMMNAQKHAAGLEEECIARCKRLRFSPHRTELCIQDCKDGSHLKQEKYRNTNKKPKANKRKKNSAKRKKNRKSISGRRKRFS